VLENGVEFKIKTRPIDPADPFRGRYVAIACEVNIPESLKQPLGYWDNTSYIHLKTGKDGFAEVADISNEPIAEKGVLKLDNVYIGDSNTLRLPFDRYYMKESAAPKAETAYLRNQGNTYITLRVKNGKGAISGLYINDMPVEDYIKNME